MTTLNGAPRDSAGLLSALEKRLGKLERQGRGFSVPIYESTASIAQDDPPTEPPSIATGTLWIDTNDGNKIYRWDGSSWIPTLDPTVDIARNNAAVQIASWQDPVGSGDGLVTLYRQSSAPGLHDVGDLWADTDDNALYKWNGSSWVAQGDTQLGNLLGSPPLSSTVADGQIKTFWANSEPTASGFGDVWVKTSDTPSTLWRWNNYDWVQVVDWSTYLQQGELDSKISTFYQNDPPTALAAGDIWYDLNNGNQMYRAAAPGVSTIGPGAWEIVDDQNKTTTFYQRRVADGIPVAKAVGDLWYDTENGNKLYRAESIGADQITAGEWVAADDQRKTSTFYWNPATDGGGTLPAPTALAVGDIWYNTGDGNKQYVARSVGANEIVPGEWVLADDKNKTTTYTNNTGIPPTATAIGDLWIDQLDGNKLYRAESIGADQIIAGEWVSVQDLSIATAQSAATAAIIQGGVNTNPIFDDWPTGQSYPTSYWSSGHAVKETTILRTLPYAARFNVTAGVTNYTYFASTTFPNTEYVTVTLDVYLVSGDFSGAGCILEWRNTVSAGYWTVIRLGDEIPSPTLGQWYRVTKTLKRSATFTGTYLHTRIYPVGGHTTLGTITAKNIIFDQAQFRAATQAEIDSITTAASVTALTAVVDGKVTTFYQGSIPTSIATGDLWVNTSSGNKLYRASGVGATTIQTTLPNLGWYLVQDSTSAQTTANLKTKTFVQGSVPVATTIGDIWYNSADSHKQYRAEQAGSSTITGSGGGGWVLVRDGGIDTAISTANGKNKVFWSASTPTASAISDIWFNTAQGNKMYQWSGSAWLPAQLGSSAIGTDAITALHIFPGTVSATEIATGAITATKLETSLVLAGTILIGEGDSRIVIDKDGGFEVYSPSGRTYFPVDGTDTVISGKATLQSATTLDELVIKGANNTLEGTLSLNSEIGNPTRAPEVSVFWANSVSRQCVAPTTNAPDQWFHVSEWDATYWAINVSEEPSSALSTTLYGNGLFFRLVTKSTGATAGTVTISGLPSDIYFYPGTSFVRVGSSVWGYGADISGTYYKQVAIRINTSGVYQTHFEYAEPYFDAYSNPLPPMSIWADATYVFMAFRDPATAYARINRYTISGSGIRASTLMVQTNFVCTPGNLYVGSADYGATKYVVQNLQTGAMEVLTGGSPAGRDTTAGFGSPGNKSMRGVVWDSALSRFFGFADNGDVWKFTTARNNTNRTAKYTWYNSSSGLESMASDAVTYSVPARRPYIVRGDVLPGSMAGTNEPNKIRIYVANQKQPEISAGETLAVYETPSTGGANSPGSNGFAGLSDPGEIKSEAGGGSPIISLKGLGSGRVGPLAWDNDGISTSSIITVNGNSNFTTTAGSGFQAPANGILAETSFVAPPGGAVQVLATAYCKSNGTNVIGFSPQVNTGSTIRGGSVVYAANLNDGAANVAVENIKVTAIAFVTGLTPGASYNAFINVYRDAATVNAVANSRLRILPLII